MKTKIRSKFPLTVLDTIITGVRPIPITLEIHEDCVIAFLTQDENFFAEGKTVQDAKENLLLGLKDELQFFQKHEDELSDPLKAQHKLLKKLLM
jgi:hypothetical protein